MNHLKIPLLPLPQIVFFPKTSLPLFVDEPTYGRMIRDCVQRGGILAISQAYPQRSGQKGHPGASRQQYRPASICCVGIPYILEEFAGGGMKVLIKGVTRARLISISQNIPYPIYNAELLQDQFFDKDKSSGQFTGQLAHIHAILDNWVIKNVPDSLEREAFMNGLESIEHVLNYVSMLLIRDPEVRQSLLETDSLVDRVHLLGALLQKGIPLNEDRVVCQAMKHFETLERMQRAAH